MWLESMPPPSPGTSCSPGCAWRRTRDPPGAASTPDRVAAAVRPGPCRSTPPAALGAGIGGCRDLGGEAGLRGLARHLHAAAVVTEFPAVIDAPHAGLFDPAEIERGAPVRTELGDEPGPAARGPVGDEALAQQLHPLDPPTRRQLAGQHDRGPVATEQIAHRRPRSGQRQQLVVFPIQHGRLLPARRERTPAAADVADGQKRAGRESTRRLGRPHEDCSDGHLAGTSNLVLRLPRNRDMRKTVLRYLRYLTMFAAP